MVSDGVLVNRNAEKITAGATLILTLDRRWYSSAAFMMDPLRSVSETLFQPRASLVPLSPFAVLTPLTPRVELARCF